MEAVVIKEANSNLAHVPLPTIRENDNNVVDGQEFEIPNTSVNQRASNGRHLDPSIDHAKLKRVIARRQYSQKYRLKQVHHVARLEHNAKVLQAYVSILRPRIEYVRSQNALLQAENESLKRKLAAKSGELLFKEARFEALTKEKDVLDEKNEEKKMQELMPADFLTVGLSPAENYEHLDVNPNQPSFDLSLGPSCLDDGGESPRDDHQVENFNMNQPADHHDFM